MRTKAIASGPSTTVGSRRGSGMGRHSAGPDAERRFSGALLGVLLAILGASQVAAAPRPARFERLGLEDGLSQNTVLTMVQDSEGFMWFGTEDGLNRFDGAGFKHFRHSRKTLPGELTGSYIRAVDLDSEGRLWVATDGGGVAVWDPAEGRFSTYRHDPSRTDSLGADGVRAILADDSGAVWVGTRERGLDVIDPSSGKVSHFRHDPKDPTSISDDRILALATDRTGQLWIGTERGLNRLDRASGQFERFGDKRVRAIFEDRNGSLWIGTKRSGLLRLDTYGEVLDTYVHDPSDPASLSHNTIRTILQDGAGRLWVGTVQGLNLFDEETDSFSIYKHDPADVYSLSSDDIMALYADRGGILWVGTKSGGLSRWNPRTWSFGHHKADPTSANALSSPLVTSFSQDTAGRLWVGTMGGGLNRFNPVTGDWKQYRADRSNRSGLASDHVMAMLHDYQGNLWIGTMNAGLGRFDSSSETFEFYGHDAADPRSLSADAVMSLFEDSQGRIWAGTFRGGISRFDRRSGDFDRFMADPEDPTSLASPIVTAFAQDLTGAVWVATDGGGLHLFDESSGTFHRFQHDSSDPESVGSETIYALHVDAGGSLWIGTRGGGLSRLLGSSRAPQEVKFRSYTSSDGLGNSDVYGIESDSAGNIWASTNSGLSRLDPRSGIVKNYRRSHGLQESEFNFGAHFRSSNGELYFGGVNGFNAFHPSSLEENPVGPQVAVTSVLVNNEPLERIGRPSAPAKLRLGHRDDIVQFRFAALDYADPAANRIAYMLEGFDEDWVELSGAGRATYTNLDAGDYVLRLRAANSDGVWRQEGLTLSASVAPAPWESWWAYTLYGLAVGALLYGFVRIQRRKVEREEEYSRELEAEVQLRTGELKDRNSELTALNERLLDASLTDSLTGLRNRRFLFEEVVKDISLVRRRNYEVSGGQKDPKVFDLVFLMVDLDHFKSINDSFGHQAGDHVLVEVRSLLLATCRSSDTVIRWGGDEFLIVARDTDADQAAGLAERISESVGKHVIQLGNGQVARMTVSVGFACFPFIRAFPDAVTWEQVLQFADSAMYEAKQQRDGWVGFLSTENTIAQEGVLRMIQETPNQLVREGIIEVRRSAPKAPIESSNGESSSLATNADAG